MESGGVEEAQAPWLDISRQPKRATAEACQIERNRQWQEQNYNVLLALGGKSQKTVSLVRYFSF